MREGVAVGKKGRKKEKKEKEKKKKVSVEQYL